MTCQPEFSLVVGYGTDMGNAEDAAMSFAEAAQDALGIAIEAVELNQVEMSQLRSATHFIVVTSTFGEGEFPDSATVFWEAISAENVAPMPHVRFAVLALGDTSYDLFCNAGRLLDERLEALGATRLMDRVDIDGAYRQIAESWTTDMVKLLVAEGTRIADPAPAVPVRSGARPPRQPVQDPVETVEARVVVNKLLSAPGSDKEVRHYELAFDGIELPYSAGDSIAVQADNDPALVDAILTELRVGPDHIPAGYDEPMGVLLAQRLEIRLPSRALLAVAAARTGRPDGSTADEGSRWYGMDVLDLIRMGGLTTEETVDALRPLQSRDYSIASSPLVHPGRVHLTVATVRYAVGDRRYGGLASTYLADRGDTVRVRLRPNHAFRLPAAEVPIIMVGPGTGVAPFRGFLQERRATRAPGRSWLFFGERRRATDFHYAEELRGFRDCGTLTRLDLAFSREDAVSGAKRYVQHQLWDNGAEVFGWLQDGAHLYVCGDAERMAKDVDATLRAVVARWGRMEGPDAHAYVNELVRQHRYVRDVY